jgi:hypothetical protein
MPFSGTDAAERAKSRAEERSKQRHASLTIEEGTGSLCADVVIEDSHQKHWEKPGEPSKAPANLYTTSIHALVSACQKLARTTKLPASRKAFRGLGRMKLGDEWFKSNERGSRCGVELGFMSTTLDRKVALEYSGVKRGKAGMVFEFELGAVDIGARLDSLSMYPGNEDLDALCIET